MRPLLTGLLMAACTVPFGWSFLLPLPLALFFDHLAQAPSARRAARRALWTGTAFFALHLIWLPLSFSQLFGAWFAFLFPLLWLIEGAMWALLAWLVALSTSRPARRIWLLAFGWILMEWLRHLGPLAFPWGTLGYALLPTPLIQTADLGGVLLSSLLVTLLAAALVRAARGELRPLALTVLLWGGGLAYGLTRRPAEGTPKTALLVQGNIDPLGKAQATVRPLPTYLALSERARPGQLVIWPESAVAEWELGPSAPTPLISGVGVQGAFDPLTGQIYNANRVLAWDGRSVSKYDKSYLVPFGERFPLRHEADFIYDPIFKAMGFPPLEGYRPDSSFHPLELRGERYAAYVCYESVFPEVVRSMVAGGADVLVNVSNDGWYRVGSGIEQHFQMGRVRAIETRRYLLRAGNIGVTAVIDDLGEVRSRLPLNVPDTLEAAYLPLQGQTPFVRFGDAPVVIVSVLGIGVTLLRRRRYDF
nr:apolipoprotein N-acyltransferase [Deinobacterium chartae]